MAPYTEIPTSPQPPFQDDQESSESKLPPWETLELGRPPIQEGNMDRTQNYPKPRVQAKGEKSWRAPIVILASLLSGIILAVLHDLMNHILSGNMVDPDGLWNQQWTSRYGTALAFLIRLSFVTCADTAFVQRQWFNLSTNGEAIRVRDLDVLSNILSTPIYLFSSAIWLKNPLLSLIAIVSWILPFAVIITPGTLSVQTTAHSYVANRPAQELFILNEDELAQFFDENKTENNITRSVQWVGESPELSSLAFATASSSQILPIISDFANQTYFMDFVGPALNCTMANSTMNAAATKIAQYNQVDYLSWIGDLPSSADGNSLQNYTFQTSVPDVCQNTLKSQQETPNTLWIAWDHNLNNGDDEYTGWNDHLKNDQYYTSSYSVVECQLWNASYEIEFAYQNFEQNITVHDLTYQNLVTSMSGPDCDAIMASQQLNYLPRAFLAAFGALVVGTNVGNESDRGQGSHINLLSIDFSMSAEQFAAGVEEVFQNITLSLFAVPSLWESNYSANVTTNITIWSNTYAYDRHNLLLAYGLALVASLICCLVGIHSFYKNGGSFRNCFSTYIRVIEGSDLDFAPFIPVGDNGADPLHKDFGDKRITLSAPWH